jgi:hypothetical protein
LLAVFSFNQTQDKPNILVIWGDDMSKATRMSGTSIDITERKRSEKEIVKQQEELEKVNQELRKYHKNFEKFV